MNEETTYLVNYRLEKALNCLEEGRVIAKNNLFHGAVNRLYYSCFYAVTALLLSKGLNSKTHKGVRNLFHIHFIETKLFSANLSKFFSQIFNARHKSDYEDFVLI